MEIIICCIFSRNSILCFLCSLDNKYNTFTLLKGTYISIGMAISMKILCLKHKKESPKNYKIIIYIYIQIYYYIIAYTLCELSILIIFFYQMTTYNIKILGNTAPYVSGSVWTLKLTCYYDPSITLRSVSNAIQPLQSKMSAL